MINFTFSLHCHESAVTWKNIRPPPLCPVSTERDAFPKWNKPLKMGVVFLAEEDGRFISDANQSKSSFLFPVKNLLLVTKAMDVFAAPLKNTNIPVTVSDWTSLLGWATYCGLYLCCMSMFFKFFKRGTYFHMVKLLAWWKCYKRKFLIMFLVFTLISNYLSCLNILVLNYFNDFVHTC